MVVRLQDGCLPGSSHALNATTEFVTEHERRRNKGFVIRIQSHVLENGTEAI